MNDHYFQEDLVKETGTATDIQTQLKGILAETSEAVLPESWYSEHTDEVVPIICRWILEQRISGNTDTSITRHLISLLKLDEEIAGELMAMALIAGEAAADVEDLRLDPDQAIARVIDENNVSRALATELVNMGLTLFHDTLNALSNGDEFEVGVEEEAAKAYLAAADYVIDSFEAGRGKKEICDKLVQKNIFTEETAPGFIDDVVLAEIAASRVNNGEEGTVVFEELKLQEGSPYILMLALHLVNDDNHKN